MGAARIITAFPLDTDGLEYLLSPYNVRSEVCWMTEDGIRCGQLLGQGFGYRIGEDSWRQIIVEPASVNEINQDMGLVRRRLGSRFKPVEPAASLVVMYPEKPGFSSQGSSHNLTFEVWNALPLSDHGWQMVLTLANTLASWAPTLIDDLAIEGLWHIERGQWVREGPGYVYDLQTWSARRPGRR